MTTITLDSVIYDLSGTNATISGFDSQITSNLVIPSTITNSETTYNITSIKNSAFKNFAIDVSNDIQVNKYNTIVIWCESFNEFITSAKYQ